MTDNLQTDVVIVGAGPVGIFAVFECGMLGLRCCVIDSLDQIGGQCTALYPEKPIYDIPASPEILAADLIASLEKQAAPFRPLYRLSEQVVSVSKSDSGFTVITSRGVEISCRAIIIAGGAGSFGPHKPPLDNITEFEGKSVFYSVKNKDQFRGQTLVIAGGGDSAVDWALSLSSIAKYIYLVHRRDKFRAAPSNVEHLRQLEKQGRLEIVVPYQLKSLTGDNGHLKTVEVVDLDGNIRSLSADILLSFFGLAAELGPIAGWGLHLDHHHIAVSQATCETNVNGIFSIGDMATYPHKLKLILTGFAEAAQAAHAIYKLVYPDKELHFEYSTTKGLPR